MSVNTIVEDGPGISNTPSQEEVRSAVDTLTVIVGDAAAIAHDPGASNTLIRTAGEGGDVFHVTKRNSFTSTDPYALNPADYWTFRERTRVDMIAPPKKRILRPIAPDMDEAVVQRESSFVTYRNNQDRLEAVERVISGTGNIITRRVVVNTNENGELLVRTFLSTTSAEGDLMRKKELRSDDPTTSRAALETAKAIVKRVTG